MCSSPENWMSNLTNIYSIYSMVITALLSIIITVMDQKFCEMVARATVQAYQRRVRGPSLSLHLVLNAATEVEAKLKEAT